MIKKRSDFWSSVTHSLVKPDTERTDKPLLEVMSHSLKIVAVETYYVQDEKFPEDLKTELAKLSDGKCYARYSFAINNKYFVSYAINN